MRTHSMAVGLKNHRAGPRIADLFSSFAKTVPAFFAAPGTSALRNLSDRELRDIGLTRADLSGRCPEELPLTANSQSRNW